VPYLRRELDVGYSVASFDVAALAIGSVAGAVVSRRVEYASSRRTLVALGAAGMAAGGVSLAAAPNVIGTLGAALLMGVSGTWSLVVRRRRSPTDMVNPAPSRSAKRTSRQA
jgi:hypothetical protein